MLPPGTIAFNCFRMVNRPSLERATRELSPVGSITQPTNTEFSQFGEPTGGAYGRFQD